MHGGLQAKSKAGDAAASQALDARLRGLEQQLGALAEQGHGQRIAAAEWRTTQVQSPCISTSNHNIWQDSCYPII